MKLHSTCNLIFVIGLIAMSSCGINVGIESSFEGTKTGEELTDLESGRVWVRSFQHQKIGSYTTSYAASTTGHTASGYSLEMESIQRPSPEILDVIRNSGIFKSVTPIETNTQSDFILEGAVNAEWKTPWWTWIQFLDGGFHAWIFPTFGGHLVANAEIWVYDKDYNQLYSATVDSKKVQMGVIWY